MQNAHFVRVECWVSINQYIYNKTWTEWHEKSANNLGSSLECWSHPHSEFDPDRVTVFLCRGRNTIFLHVYRYSFFAFATCDTQGVTAALSAKRKCSKSASLWRCQSFTIDDTDIFACLQRLRRCFSMEYGLNINILLSYSLSLSLDDVSSSSS